MMTSVPLCSEHLVGDGGVVVAADVMSHEAGRGGMAELDAGDHAGGLAQLLSLLGDKVDRLVVDVHADITIVGLHRLRPSRWRLKPNQ